MKLSTFLAGAKKAVGALATVEATAVAMGFLNNALAGIVTAVLGVCTSVIVYILRNDTPAPTPPPAV